MQVTVTVDDSTDALLTKWARVTGTPQRPVVDRLQEFVDQRLADAHALVEQSEVLQICAAIRAATPSARARALAEIGLQPGEFVATLMKGAKG